MTESYNQSAYEAGYPLGIERHFWNIARNDLLYRWLTPLLNEGDLVMDVGCGRGIAVQDLSSRGLNIRGVELGPAPVMPDLEAFIDTSTDLFDLDASIKQDIRVVLLLDVIEHMQDRRQFLQRIHSELPNCRSVLLTVPARMELWSGYDSYWGHHLRYSKSALADDLESAGYVVGKNAYFFHWVYLASLLSKLAGVSRQTDFQPINAGGLKAWCHRALGLFTCLESRLVPGWVLGSSLICIASPGGDQDQPSGMD